MMVIAMAVDTTYVTCVQHVIGLFHIVGLDILWSTVTDFVTKIQCDKICISIDKIKKYFSVDIVYTKHLNLSSVMVIVDTSLTI